MKLRLTLREPINSGAPDYNICNLGIAILDYTNVNLEIKIDGELVATTTDLAAGLGFTGSTTTSKGNIVVSGVVEDTSYITFEITMPTKCSSAVVEVTASKTDYYTYYNSFTVFNYDIGNNPNQNYVSGGVIDDNPDFNIVLVPTVIAGNDVTDKCTSSAIGWRQPFTDKLYLYKGDSKPSKTTWNNLATGETIGVTANIIADVCETDGISKVATCTESSCGCSGVATVECVGKPAVYPKLGNLIPVYSIFLDKVNCTDTDCVLKNQVNKAYAYIDFASANQLYVNDDLVNYYDELTLDWELIDIANNIADTASYTIDTSASPIAYNPVDYVFDYTPPCDGDYIVKAVLEDECWKCTKTELVVACSPINITVKECNKVTIKSLTTVDYSIKVEKFVDASTRELIQDTTSLSLCETWESTLEDGIYYVEIYDGSMTLVGTKILHIWCSIKACLREAILKLVCTKCACEKIPALYDFNNLVTQLYTYFAIIQQTYDYNVLYEVLEAELLEDLVTISKFMEKFQEYCDNCISPYKEGGCGCS